MAEPIVTGEEMRDAERAAIGGGTSVDTLMRRAGEGAADWIWRMSAGRSATVLCGPGNNGGDGYVIARRLRELGAKVSVVAPLAPKTGAARSARAEWGDPVSEEWSEEGGDVFVDALFGTGLSRGLSAELQQLVHRLANRHGLSVAVDLPSGVSSDDGALFDDIPSYDLALALGALKPAHFLLPAAAHIGSLRTVDIGLGDIRHRAETLDRPQIEAPRADAHKYSRGLALVVGGAMPGASLLAARAAQGAGAGFVQLASDETAAVPHDIVQVDGDLEHALSDERIDAALVGPGLGRDQDASRRLQRALAAKNLRHAQIGLLVGGALKYLMVLIIIVPGIALAGILRENPLEDPDLAYLTLVNMLLPAGVRGLILCGLFASLMSTLDSIYNSVSTLWAIDIYKRYLKPDASEYQVVRAGKRAIIATLLAGVMFGFVVVYVKYGNPQFPLTHWF